MPYNPKFVLVPQLCTENRTYSFQNSDDIEMLEMLGRTLVLTFLLSLPSLENAILHFQIMWFLS